MKQLGQVEVLVPTPWYKNETFWMGVASSLVATTIFWYFIHDMLHVGSQHKESDNVDIE